MRIVLITPYGAEQRGGNWHTAARWAAFLREAGHAVEVAIEWDGKPADLMIALHARRSFKSIRAFAERYPEQPLIVVLTGTDLYRDIRSDPDARTALDLAHRLVVLQERGRKELRPEHAAKTRVIYQSAPDILRQAPHDGTFRVLVVGHLRAEKDPFRAALASAHLPEQSHVRILQLGRALSEDMAQAARDHESKLPRYRWLGEVTHETVLEHFATADLLVVSSLMEGGANVICEALAAGVPVIASDISGNIGMLGEDYPGYYLVGDERGLAQLISRAESDPAFYAELLRLCGKRRALMTPEREAASLRQLVEEVDAARPASRAGEAH
jgi:putative glycosyltransferase (TIGR04348 family)